MNAFKRLFYLFECFKIAYSKERNKQLCSMSFIYVEHKHTNTQAQTHLTGCQM